MSDNFDKSYLAHLQELGHSKALSTQIIDGFDIWYSDILPKDKNAQIIDFGCGVGDFLEYLKIKGYGNVEGVDINIRLCSQARQRTGYIIHHLKDIDIFVSSHKNSFDFVNIKDVLEHLSEDDAIRVLTQLKLILKPQGVLFVSCPQMCGFTSVFTLYNDYTHKKIFTERSLKQLLRCSSFENIKIVHPKQKFKFELSSMLLRVAQKIWFLIIKLLYFIERPGEDIPPYHGDRIALIAVNQEHSSENTI